MSRSAPPLLLALTLVTGMLVGVLLDRRGPSIVAQQPTAAPSGGGRSSAGTPAAASSTSIRGSGGDELYQKLSQQYAQFEPINRTFEMVAKAVSPAVVHIVAEKNGGTAEAPRVKRYEETGSGVIVRADRGKGVYVLTNNHVVEKAARSKISVFLQDGRVIHPDQVWLDPMADIAVMNLNREDLFAARFGNSDEMAVGNWVLALGSPFGLTHSVSQGIISARGRHMEELEDVKNQDFLQTDAAINPGNSGGPLVNMKGEVIGINNSIASNGGGNEGVGFSIPSNLARWILNELITKGRVTRGALGIDLHPEFRADDAARLGLERPQGAWVGLVYPASPASLAGLRDGDIILRFQGTEVSDLNHLINMVSMAPVGLLADLVIWRDKQRLSLRVTIGDRERTVATMPAEPPPSERTASRGGLLRRPGRPSNDTGFVQGVQFQTMDPSTAARLSLPSHLKGAVVVMIEGDSPLSQVLKALDVVHAINGKAVATADDVVAAINKQSGGADALSIGYDRVVKGAIERRTARLP